MQAEIGKSKSVILYSLAREEIKFIFPSLPYCAAPGEVF